MRDRASVAAEMQSLRSPSPSDRSLSRSRSRSPVRGRKRSFSASSLSARSPSYSPVRRKRPSPGPPRRWNEADYWVASPPRGARRWNEDDTWINEEIERKNDHSGKVRGPSGRMPTVPAQSGQKATRGVEVRQANEMLSRDDEKNEQGLRAWDNCVINADASSVEDVLPLNPSLAIRILGTGKAAPDPVETAQQQARSATPERQVFEPQEAMSEEDDALLDAHVWGDADGMTVKRSRPIEEKRSQPVVEKEEESESVNQARQALVANAKRRAERKEQLLAKLVRAKMQLKRHRSQSPLPQVERQQLLGLVDTHEAALGYTILPQGYSEYTDVPQSTESIPSSSFDAIEAEAKAHAKAKLKLRLAQEKKKQVETVQAAAEENSPDARAQELRMKLLKARLAKEKSVAVQPV